MTSLVTSLTVQYSGRPFCPNIKKVDYSHQISNFRKNMPTGSCGKLVLIGFHTKMYGKSAEWFTCWKNRIFCCLKLHNEANDIFLYAMQVALINYDDVIKVIILNAIIVCILHFYCIRFYFYTHITVLSTKSNFNCANNLKQKAIIFQLRYHGSPWSAWHAPE